MQSNPNDTHCNFWIGSYQQLELPLGILLISDIRTQWCHGYEFSQMDYCDYVRDISLKRSFFKDDRLTATFEWYDIFENKNNSRYRISDYYTPFYRHYKVNSYMMLSLKYNLWYDGPYICLFFITCVYYVECKWNMFKNNS